MKKALFAIIALIALPLGVLASTGSLSLGDSGSEVVSMQNLLIAKGYLTEGKNTGSFGPLTDAALKKFQCESGVICSGDAVVGYGVYGPKTRSVLLSAVPSTVNVTKKGNFEFSGWIPYWRSATGTQDVLPHLSQLTSVMPFGYTMKSDGTLVDSAHLSEEPWKSFIATAKKNKVRVVPSVMWGNGDSIDRILSNAKTRVALEDEIAKVVKENGFDGIDIDFEAKKHETINYFSTFLKGLSQRLGNKWLYCTVEARMPLDDRYSPGATIPPDASDYANDYVAMNKYCDRIEIMAYDQGVIDVRLNKARQAPYAPTADPAWVEALVSMAVKSIDKNKIIIGVATYGYEYEVTPIPGDGYQYKVLWPFNPKYATDIALQLGIIPTRNSANEIGFSYDPKRLVAVAPTNGEMTQTQQQIVNTMAVAENASTSNINQPFNYLSWSDATAIADKVALAKKLGLRGVAVFKFDGGEDPKMWEVLR